MAKPMSAKQIKKMLIKAGCFLVRNGNAGHDIWKREDGKVFSLPRSRQISPALVRQIKYFIEGRNDYAS